MPHHSEPLGDVSPDLFRQQLHQIADWIADYREKIDNRPVSFPTTPGELIRSLPGIPPENSESFEEIWQDFEKLVLPGIVHWGHPRFMGYFGSTTTSPGIIAEMVAAALNVNAMTWRTSPAATELETVVLAWLRRWLDLPDSFGAVVHDTASIAILHALAAARENAGEAIRRRGLLGQALAPLRIYTSDQSHSSVEKAAIAVGIGEENVIRIPSGTDFRLDPAALRRAIEIDLAQNFHPLAVVATVGTTSTASVDPVPEIAPICRQHGLWLHIDAAYGGGLALLPEAAWVKAGWPEADSLVINPHKMLFVPFDFSVLYVRDISRLRNVFSLVPEYLRHDSIGADVNYMDYGVPLGRRFRALKAWMVWRTFGREGMAARIREHLRLARLFVEWLQADGRFEVLAPATMGVVCFAPVNSDAQTVTTLVQRLNASGKTYLTQTKLRGRSCLRLGLGNILTTEDHLTAVWSLIQEAAAKQESP
jgi:aromatic-L-amino-acid decarboxylase